MKRWLEWMCVVVLVAFAGAGAWLLAGCSPAALDLQARAADVVARSANAALPALVEAYQAEGEEVVARCDSLDEARAGLDAVRARWAPVWSAWDALETVHELWETTLEAGGDAAVIWPSVLRAYCGLRLALDGRAELPDVPLASVAADAAARFLPGAGSTIAKTAGSGFALAADIAAAGRDPVLEIERLRQRAPLLAEVERDWADHLRAKFGAT
uniref:Uncharacterized protein n=1 Tax=viral metagenome TaxID=1070528 RepID=A0A6M3INU5_9ZZZZ